MDNEHFIPRPENDENDGYIINLENLPEWEEAGWKLNTEAENLPPCHVMVIK